MKNSVVLAALIAAAALAACGKKEEPAPAPAPAPKPAAPRASENDSLMTRQERQAQLLREAEEARMNALEPF